MPDRYHVRDTRMHECRDKLSLERLAKTRSSISAGKASISAGKVGWLWDSEVSTIGSGLGMDLKK